MIIVCMVAAVSCTQQNNSKLSPPDAPVPPTPPASASPVVASGGVATPEPGDTSAPEFEGTIRVSEKRKSSSPPVLLKAVRTGKHASFDRVVFEFEGSTIPGYRVEYVNKPVACGSGDAVEVAGQGFLVVQIMPADAHTEAGVPTIQDRQQKPNLEVLKELKLICDFEGEVSWVLGLSSRNPYRVLELSNPARLVIDVAHARERE